MTFMLGDAQRWGPKAHLLDHDSTAFDPQSGVPRDVLRVLLDGPAIVLYPGDPDHRWSYGGRSRRSSQLANEPAEAYLRLAASPHVQPFVNHSPKGRPLGFETWTYDPHQGLAPSFEVIARRIQGEGLFEIGSACEGDRARSINLTLEKQGPYFIAGSLQLTEGDPAELHIHERIYVGGEESWPEPKKVSLSQDYEFKFLIDMPAKCFVSEEDASKAEVKALRHIRLSRFDRLGSEED